MRNIEKSPVCLGHIQLSVSAPYLPIEEGGAPTNLTRTPNRRRALIYCAPRAKGAEGLRTCPKELQLGIRQVINAQLGLSMQDLQTQLRLLFGDEGENADMDDRVLQGLHACEQQGDILLKGERVLKKY